MAAMAALAVVLGAIAWRDATRFEIGGGEVLALGALGLWWQGAGAWLCVLAGTALGAGAGLALMGTARARGRRRPLLGGDVMLLGACGAVLGPLGLAVSWLLNVPAGLGYRWWLARRRGRRWTDGYAPFAPAYCAVVALMVAWTEWTEGDWSAGRGQ
ncbi:MAG: hypothetical protein OXU81_15495 [Gammaproteobacteria bacterium]|nr:hypothetical protein [Gammaproteobacteria bacterium]